MKQAHTLHLLRQATSAHGTEGILRLPHLGVEFFTLELPWKDNTPRLSCIPTGSYSAAIRQSPKFGLTYHVKNVPGRSYILIHSGNFAGDREQGLKTNVLGCILLGKKRGIISGQRAVLSSRSAVREFMKYMGKEDFILNIQGE